MRRRRPGSAELAAAAPPPPPAAAAAAMRRAAAAPRPCAAAAAPAAAVRAAAAAAAVRWSPTASPAPPRTGTERSAGHAHFHRHGEVGARANDPFQQILTKCCRMGDGDAGAPGSWTLHTPGVVCGLWQW